MRPTVLYASYCLCAGAYNSVYYILRQIFGCFRVIVVKTDDTAFPENKRRVVLGDHSQYNDQLHLLERGEAGSVSSAGPTLWTKLWGFPGGTKTEPGKKAGDEKECCSSSVDAGDGKEWCPSSTSAVSDNMSCLVRFLCCCGVKVQGKAEAEIEMQDVEGHPEKTLAESTVIKTIVKEKTC